MKCSKKNAHFKNNYEVLNDCRITKEFLKLESRKGGYNHVIKLNTRDVNGDITETITNPVEIRGKMVFTFQNIFNAQNVNTSPTSIEDNEPLTELNRRRIPDHIKNEMEGKLQDDELIS